MYADELIYRYDDVTNENTIQYAGYPIKQFIQQETFKMGGDDKHIGVSRLEGLTVPIGLYTYNYSREVYETPKEQVEIEVIEEPRFQNLLKNVSQRAPELSKKRTKKRNVQSQSKNTSKKTK